MNTPGLLNCYLSRSDEINKKKTFQSNKHLYKCKRSSFAHKIEIKLFFRSERFSYI